eukprot:12110166-Ditylum_brightwellii.AAC.1
MQRIGKPKATLMKPKDSEREQAERLNRINAQESKTGVRSVKKVRITFDPGDNPVHDKEGKIVTTTEEITEQRKLERACMEEVASRSRLSEELPPMVEP